MSNLQYTNQKKPLRFTKGEIERAARSLRHGVQGEERKEAINKIQNFREFHLYPLMLMKNHLVRTSAKVSNKVLVARRLKRLSTIIDKLERPTLDGQTTNAIKLVRMQDIAGCRAIVKNLQQLKQLQRRLEKSNSVHKILNVKDYLTPKSSGYGGVHIVYSCYENQEADHDWKKAKVEVQLRTELHHAWATSLEIIDTLEQINLKTRHDGHAKWRRFFSIAGKLVAHKEGACVIDDAVELERLRMELANLEEELEVGLKLARYTLAINFSTSSKASKNKSSQGLFLVCMYKPNGADGKIKVSVEHFTMKMSDTALSELNKADLSENIAIAVLVSASDVRALKQAYPNYFGSTRAFTKFIDTQIDLVNEQ